MLLLLQGLDGDHLALLINQGAQSLSEGLLEPGEFLSGLVYTGGGSRWEMCKLHSRACISPIDVLTFT